MASAMKIAGRRPARCERRLRWVGAIAQRRHLQECLRDRDEDQKIDAEHHADRIDQAPGACEVKDVAREDCPQEHNERHNADPMGWHKTWGGKTEPSRARGHRGCEIERRPPVVHFRGKQPQHHDDARDKRHDTQHRMHQGECRHGHDMCPLGTVPAIRCRCKMRHASMAAADRRLLRSYHSRVVNKRSNPSIASRTVRRSLFSCRRRPDAYFDAWNRGLLRRMLT